MRALLLGLLISVAATSVADIERAWDYVNSGISAYDDVLVGSDLIVRARHGAVLETLTHAGSFRWDHTCPGPIKDMRITTDGRTYCAGSTGTAGYIACIDSAGNRLWTYTFNPSPTANEELMSMRISGEDLWAVGRRGVVVAGQPRDGIAYLKLNRSTGALVFSKSYYVSTSPTVNEFGAQIAGSATQNFIGVSSDSGGQSHAVIRVDPIAGGNKLASSLISGPFGGLAVDSVQNIYMGRHFGVEKLDGSLASSIPMLWSQPAGGKSVVLSKGFAFSTRSEFQGAAVVRTSPSGAQTTFDVSGVDNESEDLVADAQGRVYHCYSGWFQDPGDPFYTYWSIECFNGATGQFAGYGSVEGMYDDFIFTEGRSITIDAVGTIHTSGMTWRGGMISAYYQTPEPKPDSYTIRQGESVQSSAPGLMVNDLYVDTAVAQTTLETPADHGTALVQADGSFNYQPDANFVGVDIFSYRVTRGPLTAVATVSVNVKLAVSLSLAKNQIAGQNALLGTVTLSSAVGTSTTVATSDNSSLVTTPANVIVPAGQTSKTFGIQVQPVTTTLQTEITATLNGFSQTAPLTLLPLIPTSLVLTPSTVVGGGSVSARVILNGVAGAGGRVVSIVSNSPYAQPPTSIAVPPGQASYTFTIPTTHPSASVLATISAVVTAGSKSAYLRINP